MPPFDPIGDKARWRIIYDLLVPLQVDDVLTYERIAKELDLDPEEDRHKVQMAVRRAAKEYETTNSRVLEVVPNLGYRVVHSEEHLQVARKYQKRSTRALERGQSKVVNVDFNGMDPEVRKAFEATAQGFNLMLDIQRRIYRRQGRLEEALSATTERQDRTEADIAELRARLDALTEQSEGEKS